VKRELEEALATRSREEWVRELTRAGVPCGSVREISEVLQDPQIVAREMVREVEHSTIGPARVINSPVKMSGTPTEVRAAPPTLGQHTDAVLASLGYDARQIDHLRQSGVI
jgi:crotonobetainyl-CoA:carnitine CoA-transferase CaiB-like acyl-CoA transferase